MFHTITHTVKSAPEFSSGWLGLTNSLYYQGYYSFSSRSADKGEKYQSTFWGVTFSSVDGFHFGLWSLSTSTVKKKICLTQKKISLILISNVLFCTRIFKNYDQFELQMNLTQFFVNLNH